MDKFFWKDKRVLITGHNGFKGCWLTKWLDMLGAQVCGVSLKAEAESVFEEINFSDRFVYYEEDITNFEALKKIFDDFRPEIVLHLAAQAIVKIAYEDPIRTFSYNVMGTVNVMECLKEIPGVKAALIITSDKVYENKEEKTPFSETDRIFGNEPYSASKACQEIVVNAYRDTYFKEKKIGIATARAANTFGGGDHHFDRLLPYIIKANYEKEEIKLRNPDAIRPWQYILDLLRGYVTLAQRLYENGEEFSSGFNFGPEKAQLFTVGEIAGLICERTTKERTADFSEAEVLMLNSEKSERLLGWKPIYSVEEGIKKTCEIYHSYFDGAGYNSLIENEIKGYEKLMEDKNGD